MQVSLKEKICSLIVGLLNLLRDTGYYEGLGPRLKQKTKEVKTEHERLDKEVEYDKIAGKLVQVVLNHFPRRFC